MNLESFLNAMPDDELRSLQLKINSRLANSPVPKPTRQDSDNAECIFESVSAVLTGSGIRGIPWKQFQASRDFSIFSQKATWLKVFVQSSFQTKTKIELDYATKLCLRFLLEWMNRYNVPLSYRTVIRNCDRVPSLVEQAFPGYRKAGLLNTIIKKAKA